MNYFTSIRTVVAHKSLLQVAYFAGNRFLKIQKKGFSPFKPVFLKPWVAKASGGYWVMQIRQLLRAPPFLGGPLENSTYCFNLLQMFFRGYYEVGSKSGKYRDRF